MKKAEPVPVRQAPPLTVGTLVRNRANFLKPVTEILLVGEMGCAVRIGDWYEVEEVQYFLKPATERQTGVAEWRVVARARARMQA